MRLLWQHAVSGENLDLNRFQTTRWSVVLEAREGNERSRRALEMLCRTYRAPVVAYVRSRCANSEDAEDLAQAFFTRFIEREFHAQADPARGRFRAFLLTALKHFLKDANEHTHARKRGGGVLFQPLDGTDLAASERETPEQAFERAWAQATLRAAMRRLQAETSAAGKGALFEQLCEFLIERPNEAEYERIAESLKIRRNTIAVAVHRLRLRLRELVREELADTAADDRELDREMDELRHSLGAVMA
jgi:RNA polymerase sigma-70 factor (ECF subfamily)